MMPGVDKNGNFPITLITSSRKFSYSHVQKMIDSAEKTGTKVFHWNFIDVTERCPPERHKPELPKLPLYISDETLEHTTEEGFNEMPLAQQEKFFKTEGFAGCVKCKLFPACRTRLATNQHSTSKMLKPIPFVINKFSEVDTEIAKSQLLCWKPSTRRFNLSEI